MKTCLECDGRKTVVDGSGIVVVYPSCDGTGLDYTPEPEPEVEEYIGVAQYEVEDDT